MPRRVELNGVEIKIFVDGEMDDGLSCRVNWIAVNNEISCKTVHNFCLHECI